MKIEILSDTFVTSVDFLKVFFCLKYLMSFQLQMKIKPVALSVSGYFFIMMIFHHVPWLGFFLPPPISHLSFFCSSCRVWHFLLKIFFCPV